MSASTAILDEMRDIVGHCVASHRQRGNSEAVFQSSRELGLSPRRVVGIMRGEVGRIWADELETARDWYAGFCARQAERLKHEAELYRQKSETLRKRLDAVHSAVTRAGVHVDGAEKRRTG